MLWREQCLPNQEIYFCFFYCIMREIKRKQSIVNSLHVTNPLHFIHSILSIVYIVFYINLYRKKIRVEYFQSMDNITLVITQYKFIARRDCYIYKINPTYIKTKLFTPREYLNDNHQKIENLK